MLLGWATFSTNGPRAIPKMIWTTTSGTGRYLQVDSAMIGNKDGGDADQDERRDGALDHALLTPPVTACCGTPATSISTLRAGTETAVYGSVGLKVPG